jgi:hypothetical protein
MSQFDLNIENYKREELEEIFDLKKNYSEIDIEKSETILKDKVKKDRTVDNDTRIKTISFLQQIKDILLKTAINSDSKFSLIANLNTDLKGSDVVDAGNNFVIEKPQTAYEMSYPSEFFPGVINPLKKRTLRQNLNIDTRFRNNYSQTSSSNFHFDLPNRFAKIVSMELTAFEFPNIYYTISHKLGNNFFSVIFQNATEVITIPDGDYTDTSLILALNNYVTANSIPLVFSSTNANNLIISLSPGSLYSEFALDFYGNQDNIPLPLKLGWIMGFRNKSYADEDSYTGEGLIDLSGPKYVYLVIDDFNNNVNNGFFSAFNSSVLNKNILARLSLANNLLTPNIISSTRQYFGPVDIQKLQVQLLDEYGRVLEVNNMDYSFCLSLSVIYDL